MASKKTINVLSYDVAWRIKSISYPKRDKYILSYNRFKRTGKPEYAGEAMLIYKNPQWKLFMECMILSKFTNDECVDYFGCDADTIDFYRHMYFDIDPVIHSLAKKYEVSRSARPNEVNLKLCAIKFGKPFVRWFVGLDNHVNEEYIESIKQRLNDGIVMKALGHEFVGSSSDDNNMYLRMISMIKNDDREAKRSKQGVGMGHIVDHLSVFFEKT